MKKFAYKIRNTKGFTLVETLLGLMILTIAIVAATSLLIGLIQSNKKIVENLQAHYLAQEGLEAVRNIRDTNWMHNLDWKAGSADFLGGVTVPDDDTSNQYVVGLNYAGLNVLAVGLDNQLSLLPKTWTLSPLNIGGSSIVYLCGGQYFSSDCSGGSFEETEFSRHIEISKPSYCLDAGAENYKGVDFCANAMLVKSVVEFDGGEVALEEVLTNWKGGAL